MIKGTCFCARVCVCVCVCAADIQKKSSNQCTAFMSLFCPLFSFYGNPSGPLLCFLSLSLRRFLSLSITPSTSLSLSLSLSIPPSLPLFIPLSLSFSLSTIRLFFLLFSSSILIQFGRHHMDSGGRVRYVAPVVYGRSKVALRSL